MIIVTGPTDGWSFSDKISLHLQEMDPSCQKRWNFFPWQTLNLAASSLEERLCPFAVWLVPYRWLLSWWARHRFRAGRPKSVVSMSWRSECPAFRQEISSFYCMMQSCRSACMISPYSTRIPLRLTAAPYWLGATQLKAGGSCQMRCDDLSHRREKPLLASRSAPIEQETYNR